MIVIASCTGGGPVARLARALSERGRPAEVVSEMSAEVWRSLTSSGPVGRVRARLAAYVAFPMRTIRRAFAPHAEVLVPTTNPFFLPLVLVASRRWHGKVVLPLVYDLYPDAIEATGRPVPPALGRLLIAMNRWWFRRADGVVFIGEAMRDHAMARYGTPRKTVVIETGADVRELGSAPGDSPSTEETETELEAWCRGKRVAVYVGNMGEMHDWQTLADAGLRLFAESGAVQPSPLAIVIAASGSGAERLRAAWSALPAERVRFVAPLPDREWARLLQRTQLSIVTLATEAARVSMPSKTFSALAAGHAIVAVAPESSDLAAVVRASAAGIVVEPGDASGLERALAELGSSGAVLDRLRTSARSAARERYDMPMLADRWCEFIDVCSPSPTARSGLPRALEVILSGSLLVASSPVLLGAALAIRATLGPGVFFRQLRPGLNGRPFELIKFRTMRAPRPGEDALGSDSQRLTALGKLLRSTSIDELPTLLNVLRGDMSLVGPRPLLMQYLSRYSPHQARRHEVKPGITGWAQVHGRNAISWEEKLAHDVWYVDNRSPLLDVRILARTVFGVLRRTGIEHAGSATMPEFMGSEARR